MCQNIKMKTLRPIISYLRTREIRVVVCVDDLIVLAHGHLIVKQRYIVLQNLERLGLTINYHWNLNNAKCI